MYRLAGTILLALLFDVSRGHEVSPHFGSQCLHDPTYDETFTSSLYSDHQSAQEVFSALGADPPPLEITPLFVSGPINNRVDLVFFADGYLASEKDKFLQDALTLATDVSQNQTFYTVKPLLNFWAAFTPSVESGVGAGGKPKNTTFGLYRPGTELRGVYYAKPEVAAAACSSLGSGCDFPILLGNDPLYGGLGGRFTVITSSLANGPQILRHELGHSIIPVGEEYDGGVVYSGVDAYHDLSKPVPWEHWLTEPPAEGGPPRVERSIMPLQDYAWAMLNTTTPWSTKFVSSGTFTSHLVRFSLSGLLSSADLKLELDGVDLNWVPHPGLGVDRWLYDIYPDGGLTGGEHEVKFTLLNPAREGIAQMCSVEILEFGNETEFVSAPGYYGVFPTYSVDNKTSYRPTNDDCLMRQVTTPNFCKVCMEGLWHSLLSRVNLIDGLYETCSGTSKMIEADLVPLAEFRDTPVDVEESYTINWFKDGELLDGFTNFTLVQVDENVTGTYKIVVQYSTTEVRKDEEGDLVDEKEYIVTQEC